MIEILSCESSSLVVKTKNKLNTKMVFFIIKYIEPSAEATAEGMDAFSTILKLLQFEKQQ